MDGAHREPGDRHAKNPKTWHLQKARRPVKMSNMSTGTSLTSITKEGRGQRLATRLEADELRPLAKALAATAVSQTTHRLLPLIQHALEHGNTLVLVASEGYGLEEEEERLHEQATNLIEEMVPDLDLPSDATAVLARRNAKRRTELLQEFGALSGEQLAEERSRAANRHALAARWRKEGRIFGVPYRGHTLYPAFQFDEHGNLRPAIAEVLAALPRERMGDWEIALWWTAANGRLGGARPVDLLDRESEPIVAAARGLAEPPPL